MAGTTLQSGDSVFYIWWPASTTPVAADGAGNVPRSLCGMWAIKVSAGQDYIRLFDKATAPVMGTDSPRMCLPVQGNFSSLMMPRPILFNSGLWVSVTSGVGNLDNTLPTVNDVALNIFYQ